MVLTFLNKKSQIILSICVYVKLILFVDFSIKFYFCSNYNHEVIMKKLFLIISVILFVSTIFAQDNLLLRYPSVNNDGTKIAFSYQGDIWTVPSSGGRAAVNN